jgi:MinD superfamily P-loop ATPase
MSLLTGLAWRELTQLPHPEIDRSRCLNQVRRSHCTACQELCPEGVIGEDLQVKSWSRCTDCGRCVTACPTRAIGPSDRRLEQLLSLREGEGGLYLSCQGTPGPQFECLCELSWEALAYLASYRPLELDLSRCGTCESTRCRELLGEELKRLHRFLGGEEFRASVTLLHSPREETKPEFSRRDLLRRTGEQSGAGLRSLLRQAPLLGAEELDTDGLSLRRLLSRRREQSGKSIVWDIPDMGENCTACGRCARNCPTGALRVDTEDHSLLLESWRCVQCGTCATVCPNRAVKGFKQVELEKLGLLRLKKAQRRTCRDCGAELPPNSRAQVCGECLRKRMNGAAQRTKKEESE